ncbi:calmodulin calcium-dependent NAD kinase-like isoform X2 [Vigna angularis]|uniref:calmodulin calcium-dependent NAD kinase-like isoform X2 n=1 Tax=Phaseolus angularis TaxID=3914 RepID=UPI0022B3331A|nr:calmodulin calcium-dependent NAD kinase-like isoform X2 [Vigna angularis]
MKLLQVLAASVAGLIVVALTTTYRRHARRRAKIVRKQKKLIPLLKKTKSNDLIEIEKFSHYVARQIGFKDANEVPVLCILAQDFLKRSKECDENIFEYICSVYGYPWDLYTKLIDEFERCVNTYLAFHWNQVTHLISLALREESPHTKKFKKIILEVMRVFCYEGAKNPVVVETNVFNETEIIYMALNSRVHHDDMLQTAELMHQSSTHVALSKLVTALNEGRDVIMVDTLSCESFVKQTIVMARNIHKYRYRMGVGYKVAEDGTVTENYWEKLHDTEEENQSKGISNGEPCTQKPYEIFLLGMVCESYLAMVKIISKAIITRSAVNVNSQLKYHKMFANAFPRYCDLVDKAILSGADFVGSPPNVIWSIFHDEDRQEYIKKTKLLKELSDLNVEADSVYELNKKPNRIMEPDSLWSKIVVLSPSRKRDQMELKNSIERIERSLKYMTKLFCDTLEQH